MSFKIQVINAPEIKNISMLCDGMLSKKLEQYDAIHTCFNRNNFTIFAGPPGKGKTTTAISLLKNVFRKVFHTVYVLMPESSRISIHEDFLGKNVPAKQLFGEISVEILEGIYEQMVDDAKEGYKSLIICDDFGYLLKQKDIAKSLAKIIVKHRHLRCTFWMIQQSMKQLPKILREIVSNVVFFNLGKSQLQFLFDETIPLSRDNFEKICNYLFDGEENQHSYAIINMRTQRLFKGIDEEIIVPKL
jgi:DNA replication protein DnaC